MLTFEFLNEIHANWKEWLILFDWSEEEIGASLVKLTPQFGSSRRQKLGPKFGFQLMSGH